MASTGVIGAYQSAEERLRNPILQMLSRKHDAAFCIAVVKSVFPRTADALSLAEFTARLETCLAVLSRDGSCDLPTWCSDGSGAVEDLSAGAARVFNVLAKPLTAGGYGWLRHERTEDTLEETVFISMEGLSALDLYDRLGTESKAFTGVKAEDFASQLTDLTTMLTMDRHARIRQLEQRIAPYLEQIEVLKAGGDVDPIEGGQVEERLQHMYDIVTQMPTAIRRTRDAEKRAIDELAETYHTGSMTAAASVTRYTDTFIERFETSDDGKSYRQATNTLFGLGDASRLNTLRLMIASAAQPTEAVQGLLDGIELRLGDIFAELRGVQEVFDEGMAVIQRVSSQRENARWRTELETLARASVCFKAWTARTKGRNPRFPLSLPYGCQGNMCFYPHEADLNFGKARPMPLGTSQVDDDFDMDRQIDNARKISSGNARRILAKLMARAVPDGSGNVDLAAGFNALERPDRLVQDMAALFCRFGDGAPMAERLWETVDGDDGEFDALVDNADEVRKSLNADFLDLYIDEENRVAWAEGVDGERSFLKRPGLQANNVGFFLAAAAAMLERRQDGHEDPAEWVTTKTSLKERFTKANAKLDGDGRGSVSSAFDAAYRAARQWHWIDDTGCGEDRCRVTPHVAALIERGFAVELLAAMNDETEGEQTDAE